MTNKFNNNDEIRMTNDEPTKRKFDLEERTAKFSERGILFARKIPKDVITIPLISQFVKAITSIGANYCEADDAESRKDFCHKIGICRKESRETKYWLKNIIIACPQFKEEAELLLQEAKELNLIFSKIVATSKKNSSKI